MEAGLSWLQLLATWCACTAAGYLLGRLSGRGVVKVQRRTIARLCEAIAIQLDPHGLPTLPIPGPRLYDPGGPPSKEKS